MRLWLGLVTVLVLLLTVCEGYDPYPECPENNVCIAFDSCDQYAVTMKGFVWINKEKSMNECAFADYGVHYAGLHIHPMTAHVWKIMAVMREGYREGYEGIPVAPEAISFDFGAFSLSFPDDLNAQLTWTDSGSASNHSMRFTGRFPAYSYQSGFKGYHKYIRYTFNIESDGEKFLDVIGPVVRYVVNGTAGPGVEMNDPTFVEQLRNISVCDLKMLKNSKVCHGGCDDFASNSTAPNALPVCKSHLWFNDKSEDALTRNWKRVEGSLDCKAGEWNLNWTAWEKGTDAKGYTKIDGNSELQCASDKPEKLTGMGKAVIGVGAAMGLLVICGAVALIFICGRRRTNNKKNKNGARTPDSSSKKAKSPFGAVTKSTEREDKAGTPHGATTRSTEREGTQRATSTPESPPPPYQLKDPKPMRR